MKVTIRDKKYRIGFSYGEGLWDDYSHSSAPEWRRSVVCNIEGPDGGIARGRALTHPNDQHVRAVGRRIALAKALRAMCLERHERRNVWIQVWESGMKKPSGRRRQK